MPTLVITRYLAIPITIHLSHDKVATERHKRNKPLIKSINITENNARSELNRSYTCAQNKHFIVSCANTSSDVELCSMEEAGRVAF